MNRVANIGGRAKNGNVQKAIDLWRAKVSFNEIGAMLGIKPRTARSYVKDHAEELGASFYKGKEPRCHCGLLLPCTCQGQWHAVDFMRSGEPAAGGTIGIPRMHA